MEIISYELIGVSIYMFFTASILLTFKIIEYFIRG